MTDRKETVTKALKERIDAMQDTIDAQQVTIGTLENRVKSAMATMQNFSLEKGEIDGKFVKVWEAIGSIRGSVGAAARHGGPATPGAQFIIPPLPPGVEITPQEEGLMKQWNWPPKKIQEYANAKALYQTVGSHIPAAGPTPAAETPRSSQRKGRDTS